MILLTCFAAFLYPQPNKDKSHDNDMDMKIKGNVQLPAGWEMRFDKTNANKNDMKLIKENDFYHFTTGPAAIYYDPKDEESGEFKIESGFIQIKPSKHPEAYGIFLAGSDLQKENQHYLYFLVWQDGKYLIKERSGNGTKEIVKWTADKNVNSQKKNCQTINKLSVTVGKNNIIFSANGKKVKTLDKSNLGNGNGIVGFRNNHNLDVKQVN